MRSPAQWLRLATSYRRIFSSVSSSYRSHSILSLFLCFLFLLLFPCFSPYFSSPLFPPRNAHILDFLFSSVSFFLIHFHFPFVSSFLLFLLLTHISLAPRTLRTCFCQKNMCTHSLPVSTCSQFERRTGVHVLII